MTGSIFDIFKSPTKEQLEQAAVDKEYLNQLQLAWNRLFACLADYNQKLLPHTIYRRSHLTNASNQALAEVKRLQKETEAQRVSLTFGALKDGSTIEQAHAWMDVWNLLAQGNPNFFRSGTTGRGIAIAEIMRLQALDKDSKAAAAAAVGKVQDNKPPTKLKPSHLHDKFGTKPLTKTEIKKVRALLADLHNYARAPGVDYIHEYGDDHND